MSLNPGVCFDYDLGSGNVGQIQPTQLYNWPDNTGSGGTFGDQYNNIAQPGTNLYKPLIDGAPSYTWNLTNGGYITVRRDPNTPNYYYYSLHSANNSQVISGGESDCDHLSIVYDPFTTEIGDDTQFGLLKHQVTGWVVTTYAKPLGQKIFQGSENEELDDTDNLPDGGFPDYDVSSDDIPFPPLPTINFLDSGFIKVYQPTESELRSFNSWLWPDNFYNNIKKIFRDPMEAILGLTILPVSATTVPQNIYVGALDSGVASRKVSQQYYYIDFGKLGVGTYNSTFYDYEPYTKCEIYLPYIGTRELNVDEIMDAELWLQYAVDVITGACTAMLSVNRSRGDEGFRSILYSWNGNMASQGAISSQNYTQLIKTFISTVSGAATSAIGGAVVGGRAGAAVAAGTYLVSGAASAAKTGVPVQHAGNMSANTGLLGIQSAYLIFSRPIVAVPKTMKHDVGMFSHISDKIKNIKGFVKVRAAHIEGLAGTNDEKDELERILKTGIVV